MRNRGLSLTDVIVLAVCLLLIAGAIVAFIASTPRPRSALGCASNLRQIGQAILLYQQNYRAFPAATYDVNAPVAVFTGADPAIGTVAPNDVTAALFLVARHIDLPPHVLTCPSSATLGATREEFTRQRNFAGLHQLTYSFINPYRGPRTPETLDLMEAGAEFPIAADIAPPPEDAMSVTAASMLDQLRRANSPNHDGDGQNVLYGDGHVEFTQSPFYGAQRDHIYTFGPSGNDNRDSPGEGAHGFITSMKDSILLPTWTDGPTRIAALGYDRTLRNRGIYAALPWLAVLVAAIAGGLLMWRFRRAR